MHALPELVMLARRKLAPQLCTALFKRYLRAEVAESWENPAALLYGIDDLRFEDMPIAAQLPSHHVRVQMRSVGICGSDVHMLKKGRNGPWILDGPNVVAHEGAGCQLCPNNSGALLREVVETGSEVTNLKPGDRVALEPGIPCWTHKMSRQGRYNLDPNIKFFSLPPVHGILRKFVDHPAEYCFKLPDTLTYEQGALVEPLSVAVHACWRAQVGPGKKVAILGAGPIGLMMLAAAKAFSASSVAITDVRPTNLPVALTLGAHHVLDLSNAKSSAETVQSILKVFPGGPDIVIDCVGVSNTITTAFEAVAPGGKVVQVGLDSQGKCHAPTMQLVFKEIDFTGSWLYTNTWPMCLRMLEEGKIQTEPLITHRLGFTERDILKGFELAADRAKSGAIKVMFSW